MKISKDVEKILRFCLSNSIVCNVGITDGSDFEMGSSDVLYIQISMTIGSAI
jgi:hypothetical protein